jgi:N-methylhydantoinase A
VGSLKIGPRSAGADPGPVCYGRGGGLVTLTDANLCLGYLDPERLASGLRLDAVLAREALQAQIADRLRLPLLEAAHGIYQIGCAAMARAVRAVTIERGLDPRGFTLVAFGGNGPLFGAALARSLDIRTVVIPPQPGVFSAVGLLAADIERHASRAFLRRLSAIGESDLREGMDRIKREAIAALRAEGFGEAIAASGTLDMKYAGQSFQLAVPFPDDGDADPLAAQLVEALGRAHERLYGFRGNPDAAQIVTLRVVARVIQHNPPDAMRPDAAEDASRDCRRSAYFGRALGVIETAVIARGALTGQDRPGPLLVDEYDATTLVPPGAMARRDAMGNIVVDVGAGR